MIYIFPNGVLNEYVFYSCSIQTLSKNVATTLSLVAITAMVLLFASGPLVGSDALAYKHKHHHGDDNNNRHHKHHHHHNKYNKH
ncbi:MAG: hypothetical protein WBQ25_12205 [Nitrososphaeraceae archaeon]